MNWNEVGNESGGKTSFITFPVGITNVRILDKAPHTRWAHWVPSAKRSITCPGRGCPICEAINVAKSNKVEPKFSRSKKHSLNVINRTSGQVEILEQGTGFFEELKGFHEEVGDLTTYDIKVKRTGTGTSTKYRIDTLAVEPLTDEEAKLQTTVLEDYFKKPTIEQVTRVMNGEDPKEVFKSQDDDISLA